MLTADLEVLSMMLVLVFAAWAEQAALPDVRQTFLDGDRKAFAALLPEKSRIRINLRPLTFDHGNLSRDQVLLGFAKFMARYRITDAEITNSQSDTNYSWLEIYLRVSLEERRTETFYQATFALYFKIAGSRMAISRWVLQDLH